MVTSEPASAIRRAVDTDLPRLTEIYNHYVRTTPITFDVEPFAADARRAWFAQFSDAGRHQLLVAEQGGVVVGYTGTTRFRDKAAYHPTVETTIYLDPEWTGRGIGTRLYAELFDVLAGEDIHLAIAAITLPNDVSIAVHQRFGFTLAGVTHDVGRKFDRYWDVAWYEKRFQA
jgi:phosphinothricin acetyltransferase